MKLIHTLLFFTLTLAATTCHAEQRSKLDQLFDEAAKAAGMIKDRGKPRQVDKNKYPQIIIKGSEIRYNGQVLKFGDNLEQWEKVLGKASRFNRRVYTWDELGIQCWTDWKENKITESLKVFFNFIYKEPWEIKIESRPRELPDGTILPREPDMTPIKPFEGYLEIDGAGADRNSKVWEINLNKQGDPDKQGERKFSKAYQPSIFMAATPRPEGYMMRIDTDDKGKEGVIYKFEIGSNPYR